MENYLQIIQEITKLFNQKKLDELELIISEKDQTLKISLNKKIKNEIGNYKIIQNLVNQELKQEELKQEELKEEAEKQEFTQQENKEIKVEKIIDNDLKKVIKSPLSGNFYIYPFPGADPFIEEGQEIKKGDTICIIESMKVLNEIESPYSGKVEKILVENSTFVKEGDPLIIISNS
jgi:acetyl-CoA carboxylase biotin carboxyl carrier protein